MRDVVAGLLEEHRIECSALGRDKLHPRSTAGATIGTVSGEGRSSRPTVGSQKTGLGCPSVVSGSIRGRDFGKASNPVYMARVVSLGIDVPAEPVGVCGGGRFGAPALEEPPRPASLPAELVLAAVAALSDFPMCQYFRT